MSEPWIEQPYLELPVAAKKPWFSLERPGFVCDQMSGVLMFSWNCLFSLGSVPVLRQEAADKMFDQLDYRYFMCTAWTCLFISRLQM